MEDNALDSTTAEMGLGHKLNRSQHQDAEGGGVEEPEISVWDALNRGLKAPLSLAAGLGWDTGSALHES